VASSGRRASTIPSRSLSQLASTAWNLRRTMAETGMSQPLDQFTTGSLAGAAGPARTSRRRVHTASGDHRHTSRLASRQRGDPATPRAVAEIAGGNYAPGVNRPSPTAIERLAGGCRVGSLRMRSASPRIRTPGAGTATYTGPEGSGEGAWLWLASETTAAAHVADDSDSCDRRSSISRAVATSAS
jgi:hypothetical protein